MVQLDQVNYTIEPHGFVCCLNDAETFQVGSSQFLINEGYVFSVRKIDLGNFKTAWNRVKSGLLVSCCGVPFVRDLKTEYTVVRRDEIVMVRNQQHETLEVAPPACCSCCSPRECFSCCYQAPMVSVTYGQRVPLELHLRTKDKEVPIEIAADQVESVLQHIMTDVKGTAMVI